MAKREDNLRWYVRVTYRTGDNEHSIHGYRLEELLQLQGVIDKGPNFYAIDDIIIKLIPKKGLTDKTLEELEEN